MVMFASEAFSGTVAIAYFMADGIALTAYAELYFVLAQNLIILMLMSIYGNSSRDAVQTSSPFITLRRH